MEYFDTETFFRFIGILGFGLYVTNYSLLSSRVVSSESIGFFMMNTVAAAFVLVSNYIEFNLASVMIQVFWIAIGFKAIALRRRGGGRLKLS
ncbi:MAG: hypothetical protein ABJF50_13995 [Paracoccaceae bacterium]